MGFIDTLVQDVRYGLRTFARNPGFTAVAILTLALGIGANATVFTWFDVLLLHPLPGVSDPDRVVSFSRTGPDGDAISLSYPEFTEFRDRSDALAGLTAYDMQAMNLGGDGRPERIWGMIVTAGYFDVMGVRPALGRSFLPEEDRSPGAHRVVVIGHDLWRRRFGGSASIVGSPITLNNQPFTVIGVTPPAFKGSYPGLAMEAWVPMMMQETFVGGGSRLEQRGNHWLDAAARLKEGLSRQQAASSLTATALAIDRDQGGDGRGLTVILEPLASTGAGEVLGPLMIVLLAVVGVVLLIACANIANLLLARAVSRRRETAVRAALGAGRWRIVRQLLTESLLLSLMGGVAGWLAAQWCSGALIALIPPTEFPVSLALGPGTSVMAFTLAVSVIAGLLFGLAPALDSSRRDLSDALKEDSGTTAGGRRKARLSQTLVVAQVALSLILLICAGLFLRSLGRAMSASPGFDPDRVLLASIDLFPNGYDADRGRRFLAGLLDRIEALPGVAQATLARKIPLSFQGSSSFGIQVEGYAPSADEQPWAYYDVVGPGYFSTMRIPLVKGREIGRLDTADSGRVAVINETLASRYWKERDPLGTAVNVGGQRYTIVGVARDSRYRKLSEEPAPYLFLPVMQHFRHDTTLFIRTASDPMALAPAMRAALLDLDDDLPVFGVRALSESLGAAMVPQRLGGILLGAFGGLALALAAVGLYGVLAFSVGQRTREFGVRMAMGARPDDIRRLVLRQGLRLSLIGLGIGAAASLGVARLVSGLLFGIGAADQVTYAGVSLILIGVALLACWVPARRASRVEPSSALRHT